MRAQDDRHQQPLRLPQKLAAWCRQQAAQRRISINTFVQLALEEKMGTGGGRAERSAPRKKDEAPRGLGLRQRPAPEEAPAPPPLPEPPSVVVNVGGAPGQGGAQELLPGLVALIRSAPPLERDRRRRLALEVLREAGQTPAEQAQLVEKLDAQLAADPPAAPAAAPRLGQGPLGGTIGSWFR